MTKWTPPKMKKKKTAENIKHWAESPDFNSTTRAEIQKLLKKEDKEELESRFSQELDFGTGGIRAVMAAGTNRINLYTVRKISIGFAKYVLSLPQNQKNKSIAIAYDNRAFSVEFAKEVARTFANFKIQVWLFKELAPTPLLSFAIRFLKTTAGVVITASHNPPQYNGYKIYNESGAQVSSPEDLEIKKFIDSVKDYTSFKLKSFAELLEKKKIQWMPQKVSDAYFRLLEEICIGDKTKNSHLNLIYSPLYGAGKLSVTQIMKKRNFQKFHLCKSQSSPDTNFGGLKKPNPEERETFGGAILEAIPEDELIFATDPDADRIGILCKKENQWHTINGNQIGQLLLYYYLKTLKEKNKLPKKGVVISTVVTSPLQKKIAESFGMKVYETLTGFKNIASVMRQIDLSDLGEVFVFGCEESHGYLLSSEIRDKDGIMAAVFFAEMTAELKAENKTPLDLLEEIYQKYGYCKDSLADYSFEGIQGKKKIIAIMEQFKKSFFNEGMQISKAIDYKNSCILESNISAKGKNILIKDTTLPIAHIFAFHLKEGSRITARPSGTEPKIKFYLNLTGQNKETVNKLETAILKKIELLVHSVK